MECVILHNFCKDKHDLCNPRWRFSVGELEINNIVIKPFALEAYIIKKPVH